jgi:hypothetical protein
MSSSELAAIEQLLVQVLPDPMGFTERVLGELAQRLTAPVAGGEPSVVPGFESAAHDVLVDRNVLLAAALGACDCWGEQPSCPECGGQGAAGWIPPDPDLYGEYVAPAVLRASPRGTPSGTGTAGAASPIEVPGQPVAAGASPADLRTDEGEAQ